MIQAPGGITAIATVTELRTKLTELVQEAGAKGGAMLISSNSEPYAILRTPRYEELIE